MGVCHALILSEKKFQKKAHPPPQIDRRMGCVGSFTPYVLKQEQDFKIRLIYFFVFK